ncbi:hypothetical protein VTH82DRAFT_8658 [Thermothelomyces myriococcoides]
MHQQSRHPPRVSSPASSPQTNPARTNNPRDRVRSGSAATSLDDGSKPESTESPGSVPSRDSIKKLDQIISNFYTKTAVIILQSRLNTTPVQGKKADRWFGLETDEIEEFRDELRLYKQSGSFENRPPPMIIETYIDASRLTSSQNLVVVDENGRRWDVLEALNSSQSSDQRRNTEVILERWRLELKCLPELPRDEFGPALPTVYKRSIVFIRSLFVMTRMMPCWKYSQQGPAKGIHPALEVKCRIQNAETEYRTYDPLRQPLHDGRDAVTEYVFTDLEVPVGRFYASVTYRNDCNFRVEDAESLLSSRFMGVDENFFRPSLPPRRAENGRLEACAEPGSLPSHRQGRGPQEPQQTYGSLSTFHGPGAPGTSPISALRSVRPVGSDTSSPSNSASGSLEPSDPPHSVPIRGASARPMPRPHDASSRRPSVSFQPFKAGSLSGSPRIGDLEAPSSPQSLTRPGLMGPSRTGNNRSSLTMGSAASLRGGPSAPQDVPPLSASPRPPSRYSSSFTHRRSRPSFGGQSRAADDDQVSSGKQSLSSSAQPGSGLLTEAGAIASSGSFAADDDNISEFLKALESKKTLKSFEPNKKGESLASKRTAAQLSRFQQMRETNNVLTDSMTSSIHRSSSSSSRQLANVPGMVNPASLSISSSPGKPMSPHTPHTPAIPSRLSENSIIDYQAEDRPCPGRGRSGTATPGDEGELAEEEGDEDDDETPMVTQQDASERTRLSPPATDNTTTKTTSATNAATAATTTTTTTTSTGTTAIDIPLSPRFHPHGTSHAIADIRRPNSAAHPHHQHHRLHQQGHRTLAGEVDAAYQRSASSEGVPSASHDREAPSLSTLLAYQREIPAMARAEVTAGGGGEQRAGAGAGTVDGTTRPATAGGERRPPLLGGSSPTRYRPASAAGSEGGEGGGYRGLARPGSFPGGGRYAMGSMEGADEEPLLFAMSELEKDSRRSLDEAGGAPLSQPTQQQQQQQQGVESESARTSGPARYEPPRGVLRKGW